MLRRFPRRPSSQTLPRTRPGEPRRPRTRVQTGRESWFVFPAKQILNLIRIPISSRDSVSVARAPRRRIARRTASCAASRVSKRRGNPKRRCLVWFPVALLPKTMRVKRDPRARQCHTRPACRGDGAHDFTSVSAPFEIVERTPPLGPETESAVPFDITDPHGRLCARTVERFRPALNVANGNRE